ncbi:DUF4272 domain-containing protein [Lysinibacillus sp. NPDC097287]|uniref:DUF4272 domain-containing protein n=1 Tax=Lysinibacillus sp. NPDC097287 TaxID=3364144 RepID=UPI0038242BF0
MKYFTVYASKNDTDDIGNGIIDVFTKGFRIRRNENEYFIQSKTLFNKSKITIRIISEDTDPDYFDKNIPGMMGYYDEIPFEDENLKGLVLTQISVLNTMIAIEMEKEINEEQMQLFTSLLAQIGGIGFLPNGTLLDQDGLVIVYPDGKSGPAKFRPHGCTRKIMGHEVTSEEGEQRKNKTIVYLNEKGISFINSLPQLPPLAHYQFRTQEDIARRAVALLIVIQYACDVVQGGDIHESKDFFMNMLQRYGVDEYLTNKERDFFHTEEPNRQEAVDISWQYEAYWVLIWALGLVDTLDFPDDVCDCEYAIKVVSSCESFEHFYVKTSMRNKAEIMDEADKIYRLHWACVNSRIHEQEAPAGMNESIIIERRRGLFWMMGHLDEEWDHISMDT